MPPDAKPLARGRVLVIANAPDAADPRWSMEGAAEQMRVLAACAEADARKLESHLLELQCDRVDVIRDVPSAKLRARGVFAGLVAEGMQEVQECVFVFIFAEGRYEGGALSIRAADGEWVGMAALSSALLADTDACLCALVVSAFCLRTEEPRIPGRTEEETPSSSVPEARSIASNLLLPRRAPPSETELLIDSTRTLVCLWALASLGETYWIHEGGSLLNHVVSEHLSRAGDCAYIEESLVDTLTSMDGYAAAKCPTDAGHADQEAGDLVRQALINASACRYEMHIFGAGHLAFGTDGRKKWVAGRGHRLPFRGKGVAQPSFSPSGNTIVDNDGALIKSKQWQIFGVHTEVVKVTMLTRTPGADIFYTIDGSAPNPSAIVSTRDGEGAPSQVADVTRRYNGKGVVLEYFGDGNRDFVVRALAMTPDGKQSRISRSPVYRVQGRVQTVTFKADRNDDAVMLHLESATPDASIYYEEVENDPRPSSSKEYLGPLRLRSRMVRAMAVKQGMTPSRFSNFVLHEQVQPPVPRVEGTFAMSSSLDEAPVLVYKDEATVTLSHADADKPDYTVYYSVDGNPPTTLSPKYRKPITVKRAGTHRMCFIAMVPMLADSNEAWVEFTIMNQVPPPRISPPQGCFLLRVDGDNVVRVHKQQVTIAFEAAAPCTDAAAAPAGGASVFFTLDGQPPVATGPHLPRDPNTYLYDTPLHLSRIDPSHFGEGAPLANFSCDPLVPLRIKVCARAAQQGLIDSVETRAEIEMLDQVSAPTSTPEPKLYPELVDTSLFCVTPGATIYYTLDGSDPGALHAANRDSGAPPTPTSPSSPASPNTPPAHAAGHSDAHAPMLGISVAQEHQLTRENSHTQSLAGVREYTGMFRITEVGYTQVRAIAVRQDMWDSEEFECKYGVEAQVMVWGSGRNGRLGTGSMRDTSFPLRCAQLYGHILTHVACGRAHSIMCNDRGEVLTFGLGLQSRLGRPVERGGSCLLPTLVPGLDSVFVVAVAAGERHTLLLSREGNVYSFGEGSRGQLGHGEDVHTKPGDKGLAAPTRIEAFKYFGKNPPPSRKPTVTKQPVRMIACGSCHSMALTTDGLVWMWGRGKEGQLGNGQRTDIFEPLAPMATLVEGQPQGLYAKHVVHVSGSDWHSAFVCQDGEVFTCGRGIEGQLGVEEVSFCLFPQRVHALARQGVKICQAACGREHTLFLDTRNQVWACGNPENGRLGIAPRPDKSGCRVSAAMTAGEVKASFQKRAISGKQHGSSHSLIRGESFKTWSGEDVGSAVGLGGNERAAMATMVPELVVGLPKPGSSSPSTSSPASPGDKEGQVRSLLASSDNSAVVFEDGRVFVWGKNEKGALGLDDTQDRFAPTLLFTIHGLPIKELAVGGDHMVALIATQSSREPGDTATAHSSSPPSPTCSPRAAGGVGELKKTGGSRRSPPATPEGMEGSARVGGAVAAAVKKRGSNSLKKSRTPSPQSASRSASPVNIK